MSGERIIKIVVMENLKDHMNDREEKNMDVSVDGVRKRTNLILAIGIILLFVVRCMDFYGVEGVSVYSGFVSVEKYWFVYAAAVAVILAAIFVKAINEATSLMLQILGLLSMLVCDFVCMHSGGFAFAMSSILMGFVIYVMVTVMTIASCTISACEK